MMNEKFLNPSPFCGMMDVCAHDFDLVCFFMGRAPVAVTAVVRRNTFTRDTGATDLVSALIDFDDGRSATVVSSIGAAEIGDKFDLSGTRGNLTMARGREVSGVLFDEYDSQGNKTTLDFTSTGAPSPDVGLQEAFQREIRLGERSHSARFTDGINSLLLTLASLKSMDEQRRVELDELR
jgi:predicted dehydrogenase